MVVADKRRSLIITTAHNFFGVSSEYDELESHEDSLLEKFLDQAKCRTLCAVPLRAGDYAEPRVKLTNELSLGENTLVFFKVCIGMDKIRIYRIVIVAKVKSRRQ